jgi:hypothetical protein
VLLYSYVHCAILAHFSFLQASDAVRDLPRMQQAYQELQARYSAAVELVGERDEQLEELANDLEDVKQMYRQQIETLLAQQQ